jgi:hypothetical protein
MPIADFMGYHENDPQEGRDYLAWYLDDTGTTSIERYAQQQRERAEKAEAENARLREALEGISNGEVEYRNGQYEAATYWNELSAIKAYATQALHGSPAVGGKDEDE